MYRSNSAWIWLSPFKGVIDSCPLEVHDILRIQILFHLFTLPFLIVEVKLKVCSNLFLGILVALTVETYGPGVVTQIQRASGCQQAVLWGKCMLNI